MSRHGRSRSPRHHRSKSTTAARPAPYYGRHPGVTHRGAERPSGRRRPDDAAGARRGAVAAAVDAPAARTRTARAAPLLHCTAVVSFYDYLLLRCKEKKKTHRDPRIAGVCVIACNRLRPKRTNGDRPEGVRPKQWHALDDAYAAAVSSQTLQNGSACVRVRARVCGASSTRKTRLFRDLPTTSEGVPGLPHSLAHNQHCLVGRIMDDVQVFPDTR